MLFNFNYDISTMDWHKNRGGATGGGGGGVEHPHSSANQQIVISVGKTGLAKDNHWRNKNWLPEAGCIKTSLTLTMISVNHCS